MRHNIRASFARTRVVDIMTMMMAHCRLTALANHAVHLETLEAMGQFEQSVRLRCVVEFPYQTENIRLVTSKREYLWEFEW